MPHSTTEPLKKCSQCGVLKPATAEYFNRQSKTKCGLRAYCKECTRQYRRNNRERRRLYNIKWRKNNPEKEKERSRRAYLNRREYALEYARMYRQKHRIIKAPRIQNGMKKCTTCGKWKRNGALNFTQNFAYRDGFGPECKDCRREYRKKHNERRKKYKQKYRQQNPDKVKLRALRKRARMTAIPHDFTAADWKFALSYFEGQCAVCGRPQGLWHTLAADHWIPVSYQGDDNPGTVPTNIVPLCHGDGGCNNKKGSTLPDEWLEREYGKRKARKIAARIAEYFEWVKAQLNDD
jgi:hypothetical protein